MTRTLAILSLLGVAVSAGLLWVFDDFWSTYDQWNRMLAVLLLAAVWGFVAASVATVRQAFKRIEPVTQKPAGEMQGP